MNFEGEIDVTGQAGDFVYAVSRGVLVGNKLSFDFSGQSDGSSFTGCCVTDKNGRKYVGESTFQYQGCDPYTCRVELQVEVAEDLLKLTGIWFEKADRYTLSGELELV